MNNSKKYTCLTDLYNPVNFRVHIFALVKNPKTTYMNSIAINFVDCAIIVLYLIFIIWWGLRNGKSSDAGSYFLAGRTYGG